MKNLIIIPARKGSKRIKNKNLINVLNKPLILWTINYAKKLSKKKFDLVVTSDCNKIKSICSKEKVFFLDRPKGISGDYSSMHEVIFHAYNKLNKKYKYIILLQPTSPLRKPGLIHKSLRILNNKKKFDSLIHLAKDSSFTGKITNNKWIPEYGINVRSQDIKEIFVSTGNLFVYRSDLYENKLIFPKKTYGLVSYNQKWVDIDNKEDIILLNYYLKNR
tara:strand:- start:116 stop:772 length:657 start_codon:yes stop_codon:yes gene_type:complete